MVCLCLRSSTNVISWSGPWGQRSSAWAVERLLSSCWHEEALWGFFFSLGWRPASSFWNPWVMGTEAGTLGPSPGSADPMFTSHCGLWQVRVSLFLWSTSGSSSTASMICPMLGSRNLVQSFPVLSSLLLLSSGTCSTERGENKEQVKSSGDGSRSSLCFFFFGARLPIEEYLNLRPHFLPKIHAV